MANCCFGTVTLYASDERIKDVMKTVIVKSEYEEYLFDFNKIIAVPDSIDDTRDWCYENWGTDRYCFETYVSGNSILFSTAWTPCVPIIKAMSQMYPDVIIDYWYEESGMGFCGREIYLGGKPLYTEEADLEEHWIDDEDFEQYGYSEGYHDRKTEITEENNMYTTGTYTVRDDRDEYVRLEKGTFINYGIDAYRKVLTDSSYDEIFTVA